MRFAMKVVAATAAVLCMGSAFAQKGETVRIAMIEGLSGPMGNVGQNQLKNLQFLADPANGVKNPAGVKFEIVGLDSKGSPQEALSTFKAAVDQGFRYIAQGNGSGAALALSDAVAKHNERNPGKEVVYLNYSAVDPALTNEKCNYWHFRLDADTTQKMEALTSFMKDQPKVKKVYLLNQNYSHGHQVAKYFKEGFTKSGGQISAELDFNGGDKDFKAQLTAIKSAAPDAVFVPGYYTDVALIAIQAKQLGLNVPLCGGDGWESQTLLDIGKDAVEGHYFSTHYASDAASPKVTAFVEAYKKRYSGKVEKR